MNYLQKKKLAFMSIVNRVKGFIRTVTGVFPLRLTNCVDEENIIDYTIYGNSVQGDTSVESVGEKTKNLFDINSVTSFVGINSNCSIKKENGNFVVKRNARTGSLGISFYYPFKAGKYALKIDYLTTNYSPKSAYIMYFADKFICVNDSSVGYPSTVKQLNIPEDMTVAIVIYANDDNVVGNECTFSVMLSEGYDSVPYEPYGYKIPITVSGTTLEPITTNIYLDEPLGTGQSINYKKDCLPTIPTFKGTTILTVDTTIQPSNAEVTYYSTLKG